MSSTGSCTGPALKRRWLQVRRRKVEAELGLEGRKNRAGGVGGAKGHTEEGSETRGGV